MSLPPRTDPPHDADEKATRLGFLDYHRATLLRSTGSTRPGWRRRTRRRR